MPILMTPCSGTVQVARECGNGNEFLTITIDGGTGNFDGIVTGMSLSLAGNHQFMHSLNDFIYVYAFGDRIGDLSLNGIGFVNACGAISSESDAAQPPPDRMRIFKQYDYYNANSAGQSTVKLLNITMTAGGGAPSVNLRAVLVAARFDVVEENGIMGYWSMNFKVVRNRQ